MHTYRFYVPPNRLKDEEIVLTGSEVHHAANVLRLRSDDQILIFDGEKYEYSARIRAIDKNSITVCDLDCVKEAPSPIPELHLLVPLVPKFDLIIEKATELGAGRITPILTDRTQARFKYDAADEKLERWRRIAVAASMQSGRIILPVIEAPVDFLEAIHSCGPNSVRLIASLDEKALPFLDVLRSMKEKPLRIDIFVGPPADFTPQELENAHQAGLIPVKLNPNTLRTETAAVSVLAIASAFFYS